MKIKFKDFLYKIFLTLLAIAIPVMLCLYAIEAKKYTTLRDVLATMNAADIAALFEDLEELYVRRLFRLLPKELAADTFVEMEPDTQELLIKGFSDDELKEIIDELYVDDAVDLVE